MCLFYAQNCRDEKRIEKILKIKVFLVSRKYKFGIKKAFFPREMTPRAKKKVPIIVAR